MNSAQLQEIMSWLKTTDLVELTYREGRVGLSLTTGEAPWPAGAPLPACRYEPVRAPALGLFQWSEPGKPRKAEEGAAVERDEVLGMVETAKGRTTPVKSPCAGRVSRVFVEGPGAVDFGQLLFFIEPSS